MGHGRRRGSVPGRSMRKMWCSNCALLGNIFCGTIFIGRRANHRFWRSLKMGRANNFGACFAAEMKVCRSPIRNFPHGIPFACWLVVWTTYIVGDAHSYLGHSYQTRVIITKFTMNIFHDTCYWPDSRKYIS